MSDNEGWIRTSERLPEPFIEVDATVLIDEARVVDVCCYYPEDGEDKAFWGSLFHDDLCFEDVIAWRPRPEPYKGEI